MQNAPDAPTSLHPADDRFRQRAASIAGLLSHRLETTLAAHDLTDKRLWTSHRKVAELYRHGRAPRPSDYWEKTAHPRAQRFLSEMTQVIADEQEELMRAYQQFAVDVVARPDFGAAAGTRPDGRQPNAANADPILAAAVAVARAGVDEFTDAAAIDSRINEVGAWWQGKLRRKAIISSAGRLLFTPVGRYEFEVSAAEMRLLREPPWCLDDRLLSAFELAHGELRDHVADLRTELRRRTRAMLEQAHAKRRPPVDRSHLRRSARSEQAPSVNAIELR